MSETRFNQTVALYWKNIYIYISEYWHTLKLLSQKMYFKTFIPNKKRFWQISINKKSSISSHSQPITAKRLLRFSTRSDPAKWLLIFSIIRSQPIDYQLFHSSKVSKQPSMVWNKITIVHCQAVTQTSVLIRCQILILTLTLILVQLL